MFTDRVLFILGFIFGVFLFVAGVFFWINGGMALDGLMFYKNTFGVHPLHISILGVAIVVYVLIEYWLRK